MSEDTDVFLFIIRGIGIVFERSVAIFRVWWMDGGWCGDVNIVDLWGC